MIADRMHAGKVPLLYPVYRGPEGWEPLQGRDIYHIAVENLRSCLARVRARAHRTGKWAIGGRGSRAQFP